MLYANPPTLTKSHFRLEDNSNVVTQCTWELLSWILFTAQCDQSRISNTLFLCDDPRMFKSITRHVVTKSSLFVEYYFSLLKDDHSASGWQPLQAILSKCCRPSVAYIHIRITSKDSMGISPKWKKTKLTYNGEKWETANWPHREVLVTGAHNKLGGIISLCNLHQRFLHLHALHNLHL